MDDERPRFDDPSLAARDDGLSVEDARADGAALGMAEELMSVKMGDGRSDEST